MEVVLYKRKESGVTLIALVITIIILLILAGITISLINADNGILNQANIAKEEHEISEEKESVEVAATKAYMKAKGKEIEQNVLEYELERFFQTVSVNLEGEDYIIVINNNENRRYIVDQNANVDLEIIPD